MKVLIVCSGNYPNFSLEKNQAFIFDQVNAIKINSKEIEIDYFFIKGKGIFGYLSNFQRLKTKINTGNYNIVHAHFCLSGLLANLQRKIPVITTFHGTDVNNYFLRLISGFVSYMSANSIFVSEELKIKSIYKKNLNIIPCGVDVEIFKQKSTKGDIIKNFNSQKNYILFSSSFDNKNKNYSLLKSAIELIKDRNIEVIELKNYSRSEISNLMNLSKICILTSFSEGSPQFIKESMACGCPIISTNVGDVEKLIRGIEGCYICEFDNKDLADKISIALINQKKTQGLNRILEFGLDSNTIANKIVELYKKTLNIA